jgi:hypothetical protein
MSVNLPTHLQMLLGLYAYLLPLLLYVLWTTLALWDLGRRDDLGTAAVWLWVIAAFALPFAGPLAYLLFAGPKLAARVKLIALGGAVAYLLVLGAGSMIGGIG